MLLISAPAWAGGVLCEPPYNFGLKNGPDRVLCEIQATARRFLDQRNAENRTDWQPLGPDYRIWVPPCQVPMQAVWAVYETRKSVMVSCDRTVPSSDQRKWKVAVEVFSENMQPNFAIHKAAGKFVRREPGWEAGFPAAETMVPRCAAPLAVEWRDGSRNSVDVICHKAVQTTWGKGSWRVRVPVEPVQAPGPTAFLIRLNFLLNWSLLS